LTVKVGESDIVVNGPTPTPTPVIIPTLPTNPTQNDYQSLLDALLKQLASLQGQLSVQQGSGNYQFNHNLQSGDSGEDVTQLQTFLKSQGVDIYPEGLITGYFGNLTKLAVQRFQKKYGIISFGNEWTTGYGMVGPKTRLKLNELW
jgi:murein L,D-transpeptidase YcbB/YkuD